MADPAGKVSIYAVTDVGKVRDHNEDRFVVCEVGQPASSPSTEQALSTAGTGVLLAVCDGMGGAAAGEVAAQLACETIRRALEEQREGGRGPDLAAAIKAANQTIFEEARRHREERGMGTTATAALIREGRMTVAQVGDSRAYLLRDAELRRLTRDQSLATTMVESGALSSRDVNSFPLRHVILQALGISEEVSPAMTELELNPGDSVLLCSDGLHGLLAEDKIKSIVGQPEPLSARANRLIQAALDAGAPDNVTVVLAQCA